MRGFHPFPIRPFMTSHFTHVGAMHFAKDGLHIDAIRDGGAVHHVQQVCQLFGHCRQIVVGQRLFQFVKFFLDQSNAKRPRLLIRDGRRSGGQNPKRPVEFRHHVLCVGHRKVLSLS
jgi:hypothetical protein